MARAACQRESNEPVFVSSVSLRRINAAAKRAVRVKHAPTRRVGLLGYADELDVQADPAIGGALQPYVAPHAARQDDEPRVRGMTSRIAPIGQDDVIRPVDAERRAAHAHVLMLLVEVRHVLGGGGARAILPC